MTLDIDPQGRLPQIGDRNLAVRVTRDAERWIRGGSPWLYEGSIRSISHEGAPGDLAVVFDRNRAFRAIGLYDPASPIRVKILHAGAPEQINDAFWVGRVDAALARRATLAADPDTTGYRCIHGENDAVPGLVADRYEDTIVLKLYSPIWWPHLRSVLAALVRQTASTRVVLRLARSVAPAYGFSDGDLLVGEDDGPVLFQEHGLWFEADVVSGHKTGHFLDQRDNRALVRDLAADRSVLDVFASTGGFSLAAAAGGASSVHLVDLAAPAIDTARRNFAHNRQLLTHPVVPVSATVGDAFDVLDEMLRQRQRFGLVVVDPPSFASNRAATAGARRAYHRLAELAAGLVEPGGVLVSCSCSSRVPTEEFVAAVHSGVASAGRRLTEIRRTGHPVDHPIGFEHGAYLKALYSQLD